MKLRGLLLAAALLLAVPLAAQAAPAPDGVGYCGTPYPFWWVPHGPPGPVSVTDVKVAPSGSDFKVTLFLKNTSADFFQGGVPFVVSRAVVDANGFPNPGAGLPKDPKALKHADTVYSNTLPPLKAGETTSITVTVKGYGSGYNNILSANIYGWEDGDPICPDGWPFRWRLPRPTPPSPWPWYSDFLAVADASLAQVGSQYPGYEARHVKLTYKNVSKQVVKAGTSVRLGHGSSVSSAGYWGPDQPIDPSNPINPYAFFFRETLAQTYLKQDLLPGATFTLEGIAHSPIGTDTLNFLTVTVGQ